MRDEQKSKQQLIDELTELRSRLSEVQDIQSGAQRAFEESVSAQRELNEKTRTLQVLLDAFPCVALLLRPHTREIVASNRAAVEVGAVPGTCCYSTWGQRNDPCPWCMAPDAWTTGEPQHREVEALGIVWDAHWIPVGPDLYMHYAFDVTERRRRENALQETQQRLELAVRAADLGLWDWSVQSGEVVVNRRAAAIVGYDLGEVEQTFDFWDRIIHPHDKDRVLEKILSHLSGFTGSYEDEYRLESKSGEWKWVLARGNIVERDDRGRPSRMIGAYLDVTERKSAEERLRLSEERYRTVADYTYDWEYWADPSGKLLYVSPSCERITGYAAKEFLDDPGLMRKILHPDDVEQALNHYHHVMNVDQTGTHSLDFRIIHRNGDVRWINHVCQPVDGGLGGGRGRRACNRDVTLQKLAEQELVESEARYRALFQNMSHGVAIYSARNDGEDFVFVDLNQAGEAICRMPKDQVAGKSVSHIFSGVEKLGLLAVLRDVWRTGVSAHLPVSKYQDERLQIWVENSVYKLPSGEIVAVFSDETERMQSELAQRRLAAAVEQAVEAIAITDADGTIEYVNPAFERMTGYGRQEVLGARPSLARNDDDDPSLNAELEEALSLGQKWAGRVERKRKDGSHYFEDVTISPVKDSSGNITNYVAIKRDVSQEVALEQQLLQAQKMEAVGTLAGGIAHDFNNLLQVTLGYSEMLLMSRQQSDPEYADLQKIHRASRSGADLVQRLLTFSRKVEPKRRPMDLNQQVRNVEKILRRTIPKMIEIELSLTEPLPAIDADANQIEQIIMNLAVNARDAMPDGGKLVVATRSESSPESSGSADVEGQGTRVVLEVSDTGHGMDHETMQHVFEPFYTTKELGRGTGLGLAMVYGIVELHGAHIA